MTKIKTPKPKVKVAKVKTPKPPKKKKVRKYRDDDYWNHIQEKAVVDFLTSTDLRERDKIYNAYLKDAINKMIEIIIRRYKLYRQNMAFEDIHSDVLSFLITKFNKYDPSKNFKSYSYYQTIIKRYLINQINKDRKNIKNTVSYEDVSSDVEEQGEVHYSEEDDGIDDMDTFLKNICSEIKIEVEKDNIGENEKKIGNSLIDLFENWENIKKELSGLTNNRKFNKNLILSYLRELTGLNTKDIRNSLKRYKKVYFIFKNDFLEI